MLAGAAGGGRVFGFGLVDTGGFADDLFACSGASGIGFPGGELLEAFFFDALAGEFALPCQFALAGFLGFAFLFQDAGINFWWYWFGR